MAFKGDFDKVDDEIKVQLKALINNDNETLSKLKRSEMSRDEIQFYIADNK